MARDGAIWVLKTGEALAPVKAVRGDFEGWIAAGLGLEADRVALTSPYQGESLPDPVAVGAVVVTGSPSMVTAREEWSEASARWLADLVEGDRVPVLGLCYGHQLIAHGLGGEVGKNPKGREMGTVETSIEGAGGESDPLLEDGRFPTHMSHVESVLRVPSGARAVGQTAIEAHAAIRFGPRQWGVQFHPEFDRDIMRRYVEARREILVREGHDPDAMIGQAQETPASTSILRRFAELVGS